MKALAEQDASLLEESQASPWLVPGLLGLAFLWFSAPILRQLVWVYENVGDYSHGYLVPIVSAYTAHILWPERDQVPAKRSWLGLPLVVLGLIVATFGVWYDGAMRPRGLGSHFVSASGMICCIWGTLLCWIGWRRFLFFAFPIFFLAFMVPFPESWTLQVTLPLRAMITIIAAKLIALVGIPVYQEGNLLHLAGVSLGVEDACSGIRSLWTLLAGALAIGFVAGCRKSQLIFVTCCAIPLAILQNLLRVFVTSILCNNWGLQFAEGWRHELTGWLTFVLGLLMLIWIAMKITEPPEEGGEPEDPTAEMPEEAPRSARRMGPVLVLLCGLFLLAGTVRMVVARHYKDPGRKEVLERAVEMRSSLSEFPREIGNFTRIKDIEMIPRHLRKLGCDDHIAAIYSSHRGIAISLMAFYWNPVRYGEFKLAAPHSPDVCFPSTGWTRNHQGDMDELLPAKECEKGLVRLYQNGLTDKVVVYRCSDYWPTAETIDFAALKERLATLAASWNEPERVLGAQFSVAIYADAAIGVSEEEARKEALRFSKAIEPLLPEFGLVPTHLLDL